MKAKDLLSTLLAIIALLLLWIFIDEREKGKRKDLVIEKLTQENQQIKRGYLILFEKYLKERNEANPNVLKELHRLRLEIDHLDSATHIELNSVIRHVSHNEGAKAVRDLAKIVENHLKEKVKVDQTFNKKPILYNLLEHAKECNWITEQMYSFGKLVKDIRNKESHELAVQVPSHLIGLCIFAGIDMIYSLNNTKLIA